MQKTLARVVVAATLVVAAAPLAAQGTGRAPVLDRANMDTTCAACQNFFRFANGGWRARTEIPAAYSSWGTFNELHDRNEAVIRAILDESAAGVKGGKLKAGTPAWKIGTFYASCMDTTAIERLGMAPVRPVLAQIAALRTNADVARALGTLEARAGLAPFGFFAMQDAKKSTDVIANAGQGGLGLPERDYYFRTDDKSKALREAYVAHVAKVLTLGGTPAAQAASDAQRIMALETKLAQASMTRVAMRDPNAIYHKMSMADFQKSVPHIPLTGFFKAIGAPAVSEINVMQPGFFAALDSLLVSEPTATWKAYLRWRALSEVSPALPKPFADEAFAWQQKLTGAKTQLPRAKRCAQATDNVLGEAIGQEYVKRTFTPEAKARALQMVDDLRAVLREDIQGLTWMSDSTKQRAVAKLDAFQRKIGYPDVWRDYTRLQVTPAAYVRNMQAAQAFERARNWAKVGKPVDRTEWGMTPPTVNAYYNPFMNEIVFPAGILQPPFFDPNADDAVNYGAMGGVIGHEMTHGFDDQGRRFDAQGNLTDWWTAEDAKRYTAQADLVVEQFGGYTVVDTATRVNGKLTLGENIADLGGLKIAYLAMQKALARSGRPQPIDGLTPEQRFFLSWAQVWRSNTRPEALRTLVNTDPHSPAEWRVNGPLSNMPEFQQAWGCKAGDQMVRPAEKRAQIW